LGYRGGAGGRVEAVIVLEPLWPVGEAAPDAFAASAREIAQLAHLRVSDLTGKTAQLILDAVAKGNYEPKLARIGI